MVWVIYSQVVTQSHAKWWFCFLRTSVFLWFPFRIWMFLFWALNFKTLFRPFRPLTLRKNPLEYYSTFCHHFDWLWMKFLLCLCRTFVVCEFSFLWMYFSRFQVFAFYLFISEVWKLFSVFVSEMQIYHAEVRLSFEFSNDCGLWFNVWIVMSSVCDYLKEVWGPEYFVWTYLDGESFCRIQGSIYSNNGLQSKTIV